LKTPSFDELWPRFKGFFTFESGGKRTVALKRAGIAAASTFLIAAVGFAWFGPGQDHTYYISTTQSQDKGSDDGKAQEKETPGAMDGLFSHGQKQLESDKRAELEKKKRQVAIKYFAPQIIGMNTKGPKAIRMGSKLIGFLMTAIDTRSTSLVRVRLPKGGESSGVEIEPGSVLTGQYSYDGLGDRVSINFSRLDTPDGDARKIQAQALDSGSYTAGISGEVYSSAGVKVAAEMGLTMFSGMADVLTEKESLGFSPNGVQAKSTMKNALLQGLSGAAKDQTSRTSADIDSAKDYVVVPEGKEMIIELTEDYRK
jgi:type IV secretory pathway VirB10-like protein